MGKYTGYGDNSDKVNKMIKAFYKKYGIEYSDGKGHDLDPISNSFFLTERSMRDIYLNQDVKDQEAHSNDLLSSALSAYKKGLRFIIDKKTEMVLQNSNNNILEYNQPKEDKNFMSDYKSLFDELFKIVFYPNLSESKKAEIDQLENDGKFFVKNESEKDYLKFKCSKATDIELEHKAGGTYTNKGMMQELRDAINAYNNTNNLISNATEREKEDAKNQLIASYVALKKQYEGRNKFLRIFNGIQSRQCFKEAENIMRDLIQHGRLEPSVDANHNYNLLETASKNLKPSKYLSKLTETPVKNEYGKEKAQEYEDAIKEQEANNKAEEKKQYTHDKYNEYLRTLTSGNQIDYTKMNYKVDYKVYEQACNEYNKNIEKTKRNELAKQKPALKEMLIKAINEHYSKEKGKATGYGIVQKGMEEAKEIKEANGKQHTAWYVNQIKLYKEKGLIDKEKYSLEQYESKEKEYDAKKVKIKTLEEIKEIKDLAKNPKKMEIANDEFEKDEKIEANKNEFDGFVIVNENVKEFE